jgi:hydrogenase maturation factor
MTDEEFETVWNTFDREARNLGVSVVTGHTARYASANYPMVGGATTIAVGDRADLITPDGAEPGDRVIVTKGPAVEAVGILSTLFEPLMDDVPASVISDAQNRFYEMSPIEDALVAADAGPVTAMHDATEGGVYGGLFEMARAGDVGIEIETAPIPVRPGVREACEFFDIDPWISISEGTLLLTVDPTGVEDVLDALDDADVPAADAGRVVEGSGLVVDGEAVAHPGEDPYWATVEEYMQKLEAL